MVKCTEIKLLLESERIEPMQLLYKRKIEGIHTWGIIHNGQYFLTKIPVFEDGSIDCWELQDLTGTKEKIDSGWLVPQMPAGEMLFIPNIGVIKTKKCEFEYDDKSYFKYLNKKVKQMNSNMEGLYVKTKEKKESFKRRKTGMIALERPMKYEMWKEYLGAATNAFQRIETDTYSIISIACYEDHTFKLSSNEEMYLSYQQIAEMFKYGELTCEINTPVSIQLGDLGKVYGKLTNQVGSKNKLKEIKELEKSMCREKTLIQQCRNQYMSYLISPNEIKRQQLKEAYELIPEHERSLLGDMDSKDYDYRRIIYRPEEKREV